MDDENCVNASQEERHMQIYHATNGIKELLDRIKGLKDRIAGPTPTAAPSKPDSKELQPTLSDVLDSTPGRINEYTNHGITMINDIENSLF